MTDARNHQISREALALGQALLAWRDVQEARLRSLYPYAQAWAFHHRVVAAYIQHAEKN